MTTLIFMFVFAFVLATGLTIVARYLGIRFNAMDVPDERKMHTKPIPRTGGAAIFFSFMAVLLVSKLYRTDITELIVWDQELLFVFMGAFITFGIGLVDDFLQLGPKVKFSFQIIGASLAFCGGVRVDLFPFLDVSVPWVEFSYFMTVFWFLLFVNAVNLVDGLDGLAGGIVVFASLVMVILSSVNGQYDIAIYFSVLSGAVLGFLRYNFNPASIFLGDGGSYFLGYCIACFSIMGSVKAQTSAAIAIPILALGVPLFDTILSPLRRFARGQKMFRPDRRHLHHRLIQKGLTTRNAVFVIYGITLCLCVAAVIVTHIRDEQAGLFLVVLGGCSVIVVRKLGFFEYIKTQNIYRWLKEVGDQAGLSSTRRQFFSHQVDIFYADTIEELWDRLKDASTYLGIDYIELKIVDNHFTKTHKRIPIYEFSNGFFDPGQMEWNNSMHISLPLVTSEYEFGVLSMSKAISFQPVTPYALKRIEQLRRSVLETLIKIKEQNGYSIGGERDFSDKGVYLESNDQKTVSI